MLKKNKSGNIFLKAVVFVSAMTMLSSCSKTGGGSNGDDSNHLPVDNNDISYPVIVLDKPLTDQVFISGDTIKIQGRVTDNSLYNGKIKIVNDASGLVLLNQAYEIHGLPLYDFSLNHKTSVTSASNYTVSVEFQDHGLNVTTKTVKVKVNP